MGLTTAHCAIVCTHQRSHTRGHIYGCHGHVIWPQSDGNIQPQTLVAVTRQTDPPLQWGDGVQRQQEDRLASKHKSLDKMVWLLSFLCALSLSLSLPLSPTFSLLFLSLSLSLSPRQTCLLPMMGDNVFCYVRHFFRVTASQLKFHSSLTPM